MSITSRMTTAGTAAAIVALALSGCAGTGTTAPGDAAGRPAVVDAHADTDADTVGCTHRRRCHEGPVVRGRRRALVEHPARVRARGLGTRRLGADRRGPDQRVQGVHERRRLRGDHHAAAAHRPRPDDRGPCRHRAAVHGCGAPGRPARGTAAADDDRGDRAVPVDRRAQHGRFVVGDGPRAFAKPGAALIVKVRTTSQEALRPDLHDILVNAKVVVA
ncbi:hypothetical protein Q9Q99_01505 [Curtobacterium flaccumfaciens]|nr:hypothetical protein Q9Q99_01505 [Curtobacterium flaccumfaciens]